MLAILSKEEDESGASLETKLLNDIVACCAL
jgi:hypothetical protein